MARDLVTLLDYPPHDRRMALDAGFSAHVAKPFVPEHLVTTIARAIETPV